MSLRLSGEVIRIWGFEVRLFDIVCKRPANLMRAKQPKRTKGKKGNGRGERGFRGGKRERPQVGQSEGISGKGSQTLKEFERERGKKWGEKGEESGAKGGWRRRKENFKKFIEGNFGVVLV